MCVCVFGVWGGFEEENILDTTCSNGSPPLEKIAEMFPFDNKLNSPEDCNSNRNL